MEQQVIQSLLNLPDKQREVLITAITSRIELPVPDNSIDISKNIGDIAEQVSGANMPKELGGFNDFEGGDCVKSMIVKLKEISEKFGDSVKSHTIITPVMKRGFKEEEFVIHHLVQDKKRNLWIDTSNKRLRMCHPNIYKNSCLPPIIAEREGFTYTELQQQTSDWIKKIIKKRVREPNHYLIYLYYQTSIHNPLMIEYNPEGRREMYLSNREIKNLLPVVVKFGEDAFRTPETRAIF